jgi:hypothetical protein
MLVCHINEPVDFSTFTVPRICSSVDPGLTTHDLFCSSVLGLSAGENAVVVNGVVLGPLSAAETFGADDFNLLDKFAMSQYGEKMVTAYYSYMDVKANKVRAMLRCKVGGPF